MQNNREGTIDMTKGRDVSQSGRTQAGKTLGRVEVASGFGANTREPYVEINWPADTGTIQLDPEEARLIARMIAEAAEAAEQDAFLVAFPMTEIQLPFETAAQILPRYRTWRDKARTKKRTSSA